MTPSSPLAAPLCSPPWPRCALAGAVQHLPSVVLLGDGPSLDTVATAPSKEGLKTVLQVLKIQQQFWPLLGPTYASLQAQQGSVFSKYTNKGNELKKRKHSGGPGPFWWKLGSKRLLYEALFEGHFLRKIKMTGKGKALDMAKS